MSRNRGEYRPIYEALWDGKDFQRLPPECRLILLALKGRCGALGIRAVPGLEGALVEWTGVDSPSIAPRMALLGSEGWVRQERSVVWVCRGLEFEPTLLHSNELHRKFAKREVGYLPTLLIVADFLDAYPQWFEEGYRIAYRGGIEGPSIAPRSTSPSPSPSPSPKSRADANAPPDGPATNGHPPNWVAQIRDELIQVGACSYAQVGKLCQDLHGVHGDLLIQAAGAYRRAKLTEGVRGAKYSKRNVAADFAAMAGVYVDHIKPGFDPLGGAP